jgi:hypothetical protein
MSTGNVNLDILLGQIEADRIGNTKQSIAQIMNRYPSLSQEQAEEIYQLVTAASAEEKAITATLVATVPPSFLLEQNPLRILLKG